MRIRPQPNLNHEEIGYVCNGDVLVVFSAPVNGFYQLVDGRGFVMIEFPGATWKTQTQPINQETIPVASADKEKKGVKVREKIPTAVRRIVWNTYIGIEHSKGACLCCSAEEVTCANFECGHVKSVKNGGATTIENLRPICSSCNKSMGAKDMDKFMTQYKIKIPANWHGRAVIVP